MRDKIEMVVECGQLKLDDRILSERTNILGTPVTTGEVCALSCAGSHRTAYAIRGENGKPGGWKYLHREDTVRIERWAERT